MGGEDAEDWDLYPERDAILIGTQDMLLSRALNRGYAVSRSRWPMPFGLLNTDCLWVFDEVQLMGSGLATTAQLEAFRHLLGSKDGHGCRSVWMSATMQPDWLKTVDFDPALLGKPLQLTDADHQHGAVVERWTAKKPLKKAAARTGDFAGLAAEILRAHKIGTRTIVVVNTVGRAQQLFQALNTPVKKEKSKRKGVKGKSAEPDLSLLDPANPPKLVLLHSRFKPTDRAKQVKDATVDDKELGPGGMIVVSTQVIEAGVDVSAATFFTELAPWASLVQRFGRCNRRGEANERAAVYWIDLPAKDAEKNALPYEFDDLRAARIRLEELNDVGLQSLPDVELEFRHTHVIRRKDLVDLFDTTPDLAGNDIDIDRFIRDVEETDVRVFWRDWVRPKGHEPPTNQPAPQREELCPAPFLLFRDFADGNRGEIWRWSFVDRMWERVDKGKIAPGQLFLIHRGAGGYSDQRGWTGASADKPTLADTPKSNDSSAPEGYDDDFPSQIGVWQTIAEHTNDVCAELDAILKQMTLAETAALQIAARWHDWGKVHEVFQNAVIEAHPIDGPRPAQYAGNRFIAKAPGDQKKRDVLTGTMKIVRKGWWQRYENKHFRHELASAIAVLDPRNKKIPNDLRDLIAYIIAAHHGKVRLSIRSLPEERRPPDDLRFARGVWDEDELTSTELGGGVVAEATKLSLEPMELGLCENPPFTGQPSWAERMISLRDSDKVGLFRLAYLETILCAADRRASKKAEERAAIAHREAHHA
jgi:CRISPR-associated endonuclease/helicase Cas3